MLPYEEVNVLQTRVCFALLLVRGWTSVFLVSGLVIEGFLEVPTLYYVILFGEGGGGVGKECID
jgi:hypothetical protein